MHKDATNELEMYKSMIEGMPETDAEYEELNDLIRGV